MESPSPKKKRKRNEVTNSGRKRRKLAQQKTDKTKIRLGAAYDEFHDHLHGCKFEKKDRILFIKHLLACHESHCSMFHAEHQPPIPLPEPSLFEDLDDSDLSVDIWTGIPVVQETPEHRFPIGEKFDLPALRSNLYQSTPKRPSCAQRLFGEALDGSEPESSSSDSDSDGDFLPPMYGLYKFDESLTDDESEEELFRTEPPKFVNSASPSEAIEEVKCITFLSSLITLFKKILPQDCPKCFEPIIIDPRLKGTCMVITYKCSQSVKHYLGCWRSQPRIHNMYAGNLLVPACIALTGSNYEKVAFFASALRLGFIGQDQMYSIQKLYVAPEVHDYWLKMQKAIMDSITEPLVLAGDGRNDSPGFSAKYMTYSLMKENTGEIVTMQIVDVREEGNLRSPNMEKIGFQRAMTDVMVVHDKEVAEIVTDQHMAITALLKKDGTYAGILHQFDLWHLAKNLSKRLTEAGKKKICQAILQWVPALNRHLWWCAKNCDGDAEKLKQLWASCARHVVDVHEWWSINGKSREACNHGENWQHDATREYLIQDSAAHKALLNVVFEGRFLEKFQYIVNFRHTGNLEVFHSLILKYCSKKEGFQFQGFRMRNELAVIDHNYHLNRPAVKDKYGRELKTFQFNKMSKQWTLKTKKEKKTYAYHYNLLAGIVNRREKKQNLHALASPITNDPKKIAPNIAPKPKPTRAELEQRQSRFKQKQD